MAKPTGLIKRGGIYYYRRRVPKSLVDHIGNPRRKSASFIRKALELKPDYAEAYNNLGNDSVDKGIAGMQ